MKTPKTPTEIAEVLKKEVLEWQDRGEFQTDLVPCLVPIITAVLRDAREGTVPVEDVLPLIDTLSSHNTEPIEALRAKHPNLFTI